jgi:hypothetical protein
MDITHGYVAGVRRLKRGWHAVIRHIGTGEEIATVAGTTAMEARELARASIRAARDRRTTTTQEQAR